MSNAQDFGALNWVKDELDVSIRHARQALEAYVESPGDSSSLAVCGEHLHQIARVLQMVQVYGPSMLTEEMELVVRDMSAGVVRQEEDAAEALMLALIQLPDYLEKLQGGEADVPLIILPLLNDLRAVRDAPLLSEAALFKPEIDTSRAKGQANEELPALTKQIRQKYHLGLLSWYRKRDTVHGWPLLRDVFATLRHYAGTETTHHLFWVAEGLMHGLIEGSIAPGIAVKQLFSRLDRKMKIIIDKGEQALTDEQPEALLKNLLYYIARAQSEDTLIKEIKEAYKLESVMPSEAELNEGRLGLTGSNAELAESIKDAVGSELTRIKDILDLFMRDEKPDMEMLSHLQAPIRKLADTLGMIGQGALRSRLNRQADKVESFVEQGVLPEEFELMEMAGDILYVESSLSTLHTFQPDTGDRSSDDDLEQRLPEGEYQNLIKQTVREAKVEIAKAKEAIISFTEDSDDSEVLNSVFQNFRQVHGALNMLNLRDAAELMSQTGEFVQSHLIDRAQIPERHQLNSLADVVSSIEYYLETLVDGAGDRQEILAIAQSALNTLQHADEAEVTAYTEPSESIAIEESADQAEGYELDEDEVSDLELGASSLQIEPPQPEVELIAEEAMESAPSQVSGAKAEEPKQPLEPEIASADKPVLEDIDPEILEIFLEEAREELVSIQQYLPQWQRDQHDDEALATFRRSFHTLKGSGRLVGAKVIGELAWAVENMLNRLIEETIKANPEMMDLLNRVVEILPELINCQEKGVYPDLDVEFIQTQAYALAEGKPMPGADVQAPESVEEEAADELSLESDTQLRDFSEEFKGEVPTPALEQTDTLEEAPEEETGLEVESSQAFDSILDDLSSLEIDTDEPEISEVAEPTDEVEIDELISIEGVEEAAAQLTEDEELAEEFTDSDFEIEMDSELLDVFGEESEEHILEIEQFIKGVKESNTEVLIPEEVVRACHTLHGSAHMAGITPIAMLSDAMEDYARVLHENHRVADAGVLDLLGGSVSYIRKLLDWLPEESLPEPHIDTYLNGLHDARRQLEGEERIPVEVPFETEEPPLSTLAEQEKAGEAQAVEETETETEIEEADAEALSADDNVLPFQADREPLPTATEIEIPEPKLIDQTRYQLDEELFEVEGDEELVEIFVEEGRELLESLEQHYNKWIGSPTDQTAVDEFKRSLHTLKGSSRLAGINPIGDLSHGLENLFERISREGVVQNSSLRNMVRQALDILAIQVDEAESDAKVHFSSQLLADLKAPFPSEDQEPAIQGESEVVTSEETPQLDEVAQPVSETLLPHDEEALQLDGAGEEDTEEVLQGDEVEGEAAEQALQLDSAGEEDTEGVLQGDEVEGEAAEEVLQQDEVAEGVLRLTEAEAAEEELQLSEESEQEMLQAEGVDTASYYDEPMSFLHDGDMFEVSEDPELVEIFIEESRELMDALEENYNQWRENRTDHQSMEGMQRTLHTIKGSSRLAGIEPVGDLSHALESLLNAVTSERLDLTDNIFGVVRQALDMIATQTDDVATSGKIHRADMLIERLQEVIDKAPKKEEEPDEEVMDQTLSEALEAVEQTAQEVEAETSSEDEVEIPFDSFDLEGVSEEVSSLTDQSFMVEHDEVLLDVGEDEELVQIFIEEAKEFIEQIETSFQKWLENVDDNSAVDGVQRNLHTLKGSARLAGVMPVGDLSHGVESVMTAIVEKEIDPIDTVTDTLRHAIDHLALQIETIAKSGKVPASDSEIDQLQNLLGGEPTPSHAGLVETIQAVQEEEITEEEITEEADVISDEKVVESATVLPFNEEIAKLLEPEKEEDKQSFKPTKEQVRVNADLMDRLVNHAGEVSIYRARLEQQNSVLGFNLSELEQTVSRLHTQLRNLEIETEAQIIYRWEREHEDDRDKTEFDPLELDRFSTMQQLSRALMETVNDLGNINESLRDLQRETDTLLLQQSRISTDLQDGLLRTRMVPFAQLVPRMQRLVRQTAGQLGKKANLECYGVKGELDRSILNRMVPVLEHLLRNSVSHGIEFPEDRQKVGKQEMGRISLYLDREATDVLITLSDDGKGLDIEAIRKRALEQDMIDANAEISDDDLIQCVLLPGFSTAKEVTQISGRGVGLDVVTSEVKQLGGSLEIDSHPGRGTSFIIRLPLTLAISDALLVRVGEEVYAFPMAVYRVLSGFAVKN
jgi:chemosensory pili system protein ChpA (sensor histidine kinase/response regulator)